MRAGQGTRSDLANAVARAPDDIAARLALARKLLDLGDAAGHDEQMAAVKELDPDEVSLPVREMKYGRVVEAAEARFDDDRGLYDVQPIIEFLRDEKHAAVLFQGWSYVADLNDRLGRDPEARRAYAQAWAYVPAAQVVRFGHDLAANFWRGRADLTDAERALALEAAERAAEASESAGLDAPSMARMRDVLACSYFLVGRRADALAAIEQSIALDPDNEAYALRREVFRLRK